MKRFLIIFLSCLLALSLFACNNEENPDIITSDMILTHISIDEIDSLEMGKKAVLSAVVTGKIGNKLYIADDTGSLELVDISIFLFQRCKIGQLMEFTVNMTDDGISANDAKLLSSKNDVAPPIPLTSLSSLGAHLYKSVSIDNLTVIEVNGNIFDVDTDAYITVSDGNSTADIVIPKLLPDTDRKTLASALNYPMASDTIDITGAFVTDINGAVIELGATDQFSVKPKADKINIDSIERDIVEISIDAGEKFSYTPVIYPSNANNLDHLVYTISDTSIAYIDENGNICGKDYGKTYLHIEQAGANKIVIPVYVEPTLELGYDKWAPSKIDETPRVVTNLEELRYELFQAAIGGYREIYIDFNLSEPIREADIDRLYEYKYLCQFPLKTVIGGDWVNVFTDELVKFTFRGWEGEVMYGPYEMPTEQSGVNFIDAAYLLRQKYVIQNSPYKRSNSFEDFPITKKNSGTIAVYNPSQLVWALEYNLLPTFPLENGKAEYIYEQAKAILREIITDDMTEIQKCKAIFDYICQNAVYAVDYYDRKEPVDYYPPEQQVIGFFERGRVVCEGYSEVFSLLAGIEGIEAHRINGDFEANRLGGHMWNAVVIDGKWYEICVTQSDNTMRGWPDNWFDDEAEGAGHDTHSYRHFLVDNKYFKEYYPYQTPSSNEYSAYYDPHLIDSLPGKDFDFVIESFAELEKVLKEVVDLKIEGNYYINLSFRGIEPSFDMLDPIMKKLGYKGKYNYSTPIESLNGRDTFYTLSFHSVNGR